jgi:hypothetical protein
MQKSKTTPERRTRRRIIAVTDYSTVSIRQALNIPSHGIVTVPHECYGETLRVLAANDSLQVGPGKSFGSASLKLPNEPGSEGGSYFFVLCRFEVKKRDIHYGANGLCSARSDRHASPKPQHGTVRKYQVIAAHRKDFDTSPKIVTRYQKLPISNSP